AKHCDCGRDDCPYCTGAHWDQQYQSSEAGGLRRDLAQLRAQLADLTRQRDEAVKRAEAAEARFRYHGHAGDCTIYASLDNGNPTDGICTCGFALRESRAGRPADFLSAERMATPTHPQPIDEQIERAAVACARLLRERCLLNQKLPQASEDSASNHIAAAIREAVADMQKQRDEALKLASDEARNRGEAEGKLRSEER